MNSLKFVAVHESIVIDIRPPPLTCSCSSALRVFWAARKVFSRSRLRVDVLIVRIDTLQCCISRRCDWESTTRNARLFETTKSNNKARYLAWNTSVGVVLGFDSRGVKKVDALLLLVREA